MNKIFNKKTALIFCVFLLLFLSFEIYRYTPQSPMPDIAYKRNILWSSHNLSYTLEALRPIMGPEELREFIKKNDDNPSIYTPSKENINRGIYGANLHMHTTCSDGEMSVEDRMIEAQKYAEYYKKDLVIAITDHNTVLGAKDIVKVLENKKGKFKNIRVVPGIEIFTAYNNSKVVDHPVQIHVLTWCINPYDRFLNKEFHKNDLKDRLNRTSADRDFDWVISNMSKYGIVGIAHPARYTSSMKEKKYSYIKEMLSRYSSLSKEILFTEGYYQSYMVTSTGPHLGAEYDKYIKYINSEAKNLGIIRTGSTDAHGISMFSYR